MPPPNTLRWLFTGEASTATATPVEILNTSTWWMFVGGRNHVRMVATDDASACGRIGGFVDLFEPDHAHYRGLGEVTLFETEQRPGEMM